MQIPFGKWKGVELNRIDADYLHWVLANCTKINPFLKSAIQNELSQRGKKPPPKSPPRTPLPYEGLLRTWYREMALEFHPDRGGLVEGMRAINRANEHIKSLFGIK